jgi:hypothetical protein
MEGSGSLPCNLKPRAFRKPVLLRGRTFAPACRGGQVGVRSPIGPTGNRSHPWRGLRRAQPAGTNPPALYTSYSACPNTPTCSRYRFELPPPQHPRLARAVSLRLQGRESARVLATGNRSHPWRGLRRAQPAGTDPPASTIFRQIDLARMIASATSFMLFRAFIDWT